MAKRRGQTAPEKKNTVLDTLTIEYLPAALLKPNPYNPNRQTDQEFELLTLSLREDGFTQPIIVVELTEAHLADPKFGAYAVGDVVIVDGEHRWHAAQDLGYEEVPVAEVRMSVEQMRISTMRHNRARGSEVQDLADGVLRDLQSLGALDWAADSLMLGGDDLDRLLCGVPAPDVLAGIPGPAVRSTPDAAGPKPKPKEDGGLALDDNLTYSVIVDFDNEHDQAAFLSESEKGGHKCRLLIA